MNSNLVIKGDCVDNIIPLHKNNNVLVIDNKSFLFFYNIFYQVIVKKNKDFSISFGNLIIDNKNSILLDFMSVSSLLSNLELKKGSLLYDYCSFKSKNVPSNLYDDVVLSYKSIEKHLNNDFSFLNYKLDDDFDLNLDQYNVSYDLSCYSELFKELLNNIFITNINKTYIVFYDNNILDINFDSYDNVYTFNVSKHSNIKKYNIICSSEINDFDLDFYIDFFVNQVGILVNKNEIIRLIQNYLLVYSNFKRISIKDKNQFIIFSILRDKYKINQVIVSDYNSNIISSYLT